MAWQKFGELRIDVDKLFSYSKAQKDNFKFRIKIISNMGTYADYQFAEYNNEEDRDSDLTKLDNHFINPPPP